MRARGRLFVISAPSGTGKTTLAGRLIAQNSNLVRSISITTRPRRAGEKEGDDYFFVSSKEFLRKEKRGEFLEWAKVFGHCYGTPRSFLEKQIRRGKDVLACIDVQGARQIKQRWPGAILIFILPPSLKTLIARLRKRKTETSTQILTRIRKAQWEIVQLKWYDYQVVNDRVETAVQLLQCIIHAEHAIVR